MIQNQSRLAIVNNQIKQNLSKLLLILEGSEGFVTRDLQRERRKTIMDNVQIEAVLRVQYTMSKICTTQTFAEGESEPRVSFSYNHV